MNIPLITVVSRIAGKLFESFDCIEVCDFLEAMDVNQPCYLSRVGFNFFVYID